MLRIPPYRYNPEAAVVTRICYTLNDVAAFVNDNYPCDQVEAFYSGVYSKSVNRKWSWHVRHDKIEKYFMKCAESAAKDTKKWFGADATSPIFVTEDKPCTEPKVVYNTQLKPYEFYRVHSPYQAYQELSMWFGNQAAPSKPIPHISDEVMAEAKGFDKWSFRKEPKRKR